MFFRKFDPDIDIHKPADQVRCLPLEETVFITPDGNGEVADNSGFRFAGIPVHTAVDIDGYHEYIGCCMRIVDLVDDGRDRFPGSTLESGAEHTVHNDLIGFKIYVVSAIDQNRNAFFFAKVSSIDSISDWW